MNWFAHYYQTALNSDSWLSNLGHDVPIFVLLFSLIIGFSLIVLRELKTTTFVISAISAYFVAKFLNPIFSLDFLHTGSRLDSLSLETFVVGCGMLLGPILLAGCVFKRFRSLDRMMIGLLISTVSWLIFGYHLALINGGMKFELKTREENLISVLMLSNASFKETCKFMSLDCREGKKTDHLQYVSHEIERQANDHLAFYRASGKSPLLFSDSNALITSNTPYAFAYIENSTNFRWVIDTKTPEKIFASHKALFSLFTAMAVYFWTAFIYTALFLHNLMRFFRYEKNQEQRTASGQTADQLR